MFDPIVMTHQLILSAAAAAALAADFPADPGGLGDAYAEGDADVVAAVRSELVVDFD